MTISEFLDALKETPREWYLCSGMIRATREGESQFRTEPPCCPITSLATPSRSANDWQFVVATKVVDIDSRDAGAIVLAADNLEGHDPTLRARLLFACGLSSVPEERGEK